jgi:uncharacterized protein YecE (DUF72 family)
VSALSALPPVARASGNSPSGMPSKHCSYSTPEDWSPGGRRPEVARISGRRRLAPVRGTFPRMSRSLFPTADPPPLAATLAPALRTWAEKGVYFGTSSWKYPGWLGSVYTESRYLTRHNFSKAKFEATCLVEYAETFPTVGGDFSFYQFPAPDFWAGLFAGLPPTFTFVLKVPEAVTVKRWPTHARYGTVAGLGNEQFLDARLVADSFLKPLEPYRRHVGPLVFEFGTFAQKDFDDPSGFFHGLDRFLGSLPSGWDYAVEIRNKEYLGPEYFGVLRAHGVAHVLNAWTRMPALAEQTAGNDAFTAEFTVVRALLRHGRTYEQAVRRFEPYREVQEPDLQTREALKQVADKASSRKKRAYILVNNRLEGNAPGTIAAVVLPPR